MEVEVRRRKKGMGSGGEGGVLIGVDSSATAPVASFTQGANMDILSTSLDDVNGSETGCNCIFLVAFF